MSLAYDLLILLPQISPKEMKIGIGEEVKCSPSKPKDLSFTLHRVKSQAPAV